MAYDKQEGGQNHLIPMKTKTAGALVLALGVLSTGAFAENTTVPPAPAPNASAAPGAATDQIAAPSQSPGARESARVAPTPGPTAKQIAQLEHDFSARYRADDGLAQKVADRILPEVQAFLAKPEPPTVVFSEPPSPAFYYDANTPAYWYPAITFRFDWGRSRRG